VLRDVSLKVDEIAAQPSSDTDRLLIRFRHTIIQRAQFKLELTGLRPDRLIETGNIEDFFVLPALSRNLNAGAKLTVQQPSHILHTFLSWNSRELIIGPPGSGKTTFASWLQIQHLSNLDPHLAIVLPLRDLRAAQLPSLVQLVRESGGQHRVDEIEPKHVFSWLDAGRIAIICDGFDEIAPSDRDMVTRWLNDLEAAAGGSSVIVTSRPLTSDHLRRLQKFSNHWEILPFDESRVIDYIQRWYMHSTLLRDNGRQIDVSTLGKTWLSDPVVGPLTGNPLVLTTLLVVHHLDGDLPKSRAKLYERYVEGMLGLWDEKRNVSAVGIDLSRARKHRILTRIALHFHLREVDQLNEEHLLELVEKIVNESAGEHTAANVLTVLRERTGLLVGPGSYSFVHKSVAEFLVAQAVIQGDQRDENGERIDRMRIFKERHNDRWNTILFFWAGLTGVGDLQDFVDSSLDVSGDADFKLVFGLLYDQIERLPINWTRGVVIQLLERGFAETASCRSPGWLAPRTSYSDSIGREVKEEAFFNPDFFQFRTENYPDASREGAASGGRTLGAKWKPWSRKSPAYARKFWG
jgi:NACHT domain